MFGDSKYSSYIYKVKSERCVRFQYIIKRFSLGRADGGYKNRKQNYPSRERT